MNRATRITSLFSLLLCTAILNAQSYQNIEAAEYDPSQNRWFVSNSNSIIAQDMNGDLSFFGSGTASHGMEVMNGTLFAISGSTIKGYDLVTGNEVMSMGIAGSSFLNGMGSDPVNQRLWVSDFGTNKIHELDVSDLNSPSSAVLVNNTGSTPNGVVYDAFNNRVVFVSWGGNAAVKQIDLSDGSVSTLINTGLANCDGIDIDNQGKFYVSSWSPTRITRYDNDFQNPMTVTASGLSSPADISYGLEINTLGIANSGNETLTLIEFDPSGLGQIENSPYALEIFPNPISVASRVAFELSDAEVVNIVIRDLQGRLLTTLMEGEQIQGKHQVLLSGVEMSKGQYFLEMTIGDEVLVRPFVVSH